MRNSAGNDAGRDALRITAQFRVRGGMAYELREHGARLTLLITEAPEARWKCEAFTEPGTSIATHGATRDEAVRYASEAWQTDGHARGFARFDWPAVTRALATVRAI